MLTGKNQKLARDMNLSLVLNAIIRAPLSRADAAKKFKISKPIISEIFAELETLKMIVPFNIEERRNARGVKPLSYTLNSELGVMAILDMSTSNIQIVLLKINGEILASKTLYNMNEINHADVIHFCDIISGFLLKERLKIYPLLSICIAVPFPVTKEFFCPIWSSPRFNVENDFDLYALFSQRFKTKILLKNDVHVMLHAEISEGVLMDTANAIMLYIDGGIGGAMLSDYEISLGETGRRGELGYFPTQDKDGYLTVFDNVSSINGIKKLLSDALHAGEKCLLGEQDCNDFKNIARAYFLSDPLITQIIDFSAQATATVIARLSQIFDVSHFVLCGQIIQLGANYLKIVKSTIKKITALPIIVDYSTLENTAIIKGAILLSLNEIITNVIKNR